MKIWKISAGVQSEHWRKFLADEIAAFGAWDEGNIKNYKTRDELFARMRSYSLKERKKSTTSHTEAWNFCNTVDIGDLMVLYRKGEIVSIGVVVGNYDYDQSKVWDGEKYCHVRPMKWRLLDPANRKISSHLRKSLSIPPDTLHEIKEKEDITEILKMILF